MGLVPIRSRVVSGSLAQEKPYGKVSTSVRIGRDQMV